MNKIERKLTKLIGDSWKEGTPGFVMQVHHKGKLKADVAFGRVYPYYDWASLTKIVFSVTQIMSLVDSKKISLTKPVRDEFDWFRSPAPANKQRVRELLTHSAGLTWWKPFYKSIDRKKPIPERWNQLERLVAREMKAASSKPSAFEGKAVYSDLDFFTLGALMKRKTGLEFNEMWDQIRDRLDLRQASFHPGNKPVYARSKYAPTEKCPWRKKTIQGEAHDENTWALGGLAPHAGLFGPIDDLSAWGLCLRRGMLSISGKQLAHEETVQKFTRRAIPRSVGDWGLGFTMPTKGIASCGKYFSSRSVGHLGFTGTSLWFDPQRDLLVTILSNRVHFGRENKIFPQLRPHLHNCAVESLND